MNKGVNKEMKKELVVSVIFEGYDGERYKVPTAYHDIEKVTSLDCGDIDCLGQMIKCENCIFYKEGVFKKGQLHLIVEEREKKEEYSLEDLEEIKDFNEDAKRFVLFKDKEGKEQLIPFMGGFIINYQEMKLRCMNVNCVRHYELNCRKCPLINHGKLKPGEFKILKPKEKK